MAFQSSESVGILVVEDEMLIALSTSDMLSDLGYEVIGIAATAEAAMRSAGARRPDLVLMDIRLRDGSDGIEAARSLKHWFGVPVLFVTAYADSPTMERAAETGPIGYLIKPFSPRQLKDAVSAALKGRKR